MNGSPGRPPRQWLDDVREWITRKASKTVGGRCKGMNHKGRPAKQWLDDVREWMTRKANKIAVGRCKEMDHKGGLQDSCWTT